MKGSEIFIYNYVSTKTNGGHASCPKLSGPKEAK